MRKNNVKTQMAIYVATSVILLGCASNKTNLNNNNEEVIISKNRVPSSCTFVAEMKGLNETYTTGINSHLGKNLSQGLISEAKNLGANYVEVDGDQTADAYLCSESEILNIHNN